MKTNWQIKNLGEICDIKTGKKDVNQGNPSGQYPFFTCARDHTYSDEYSFDMEALLVAGNGDVGHVSYYNGKFEAYQRTYILHNFKDLILTRFLHLFLDGYLKATVSKQKLGNTMPYIKMGMLTDFKIPVPPLSEQHRIVKVIDEAFEKIGKAKENAEKNLKNSKELFESYLQSVFANPGKDWEKKTLKELTTHLGDGLHGTPRYTVNGDYYFINGNNLTDGIIEFKSNTKRVSIDEYNKYKKNLTNRTILVSINGTLGNVAFYNNEKIILGKSACYFNMNENVDKNYIKHVLSSPYFLTYAHKEATGATIKNVSLKTMREFIIPLPSLKEQEAIVKKLDALSEQTKKLEGIYKQKLADLEELKKSVLNKAFTGEL